MTPRKKATTDRIHKGKRLIDKISEIDERIKLTDGSQSIRTSLRLLSYNLDYLTYSIDSLICQGLFIKSLIFYLDLG